MSNSVRRERILHSRNLVTLFRGGAGTGKSFTLREVQSALEASGYMVKVIAPQRQQVMDLEKEGFHNVETVSALLTRRDLPDAAVVLVDEAGQIGGKQMHALLCLVQEKGGRVILSGDTPQHGAVEAKQLLPTARLADAARLYAASAATLQRLPFAEVVNRFLADRNGKVEVRRMADLESRSEVCKRVFMMTCSTSRRIRFASSSRPSLATQHPRPATTTATRCGRFSSSPCFTIYCHENTG